MQRIAQKRIVPVAVIDDPKDAAPLAEALIAGGLDIIEITLRTNEALQCVRAVRKAFPSMLVGAGTILSVTQVEAVVDAEAHFGVSPGFNEKVVNKAKLLGLPMTPGVMTPTEIETAMDSGCKLLKFFPAEAAGGVKTLKALAGPYASTGLKFIPTGGITAEGAKDYLALPVVAAVGGSWLVDKALIKKRDWKKVTELARAALDIAKLAVAK